MKNMAKICSMLRRIFYVCLLASAAFCLSFSPLHADDELFRIENGHWMSFDHYKDADKRGILPTTPADKTEITASVEAGQEGTPAIQVEASTPATQAVAAPTRPIDLPVMPGMNKGFSVQVNTTEDEHVAPPPIVDANAQPDIHLSDKDWQAPASVTSAANISGDDDAPQPLAVRLSYLPDSKITPTPSPEHETAEHQARVAMEKGLKVQHQVAQEEKKKPEVCAAIDAYKKQQLNAIQSDRETLKALQDAIASLGLQKQLGFMTSSASALNNASNPSPVSVDLPVQTSVQ